VWELSNIARNQEEFFFSHYKCKEETSPKSWSIFGNPHKKYVGGYGYFPCVAQNKRIKLPVQAVEDENIIQFLSRRIGPVGSPGQGGTSPGPMEIHYIGIFSENIIELNRNLRAIFDYQLPSGKQT